MLKSIKDLVFGTRMEDPTDSTCSNNGESVKIEVHPKSQRATIAWNEMKVKQKHVKLKLIDPKTPITDDKLRFVCISDTHAAIEKNPLDFVPDGDVLLHAGDITKVGQPNEIKKFNEYLGKLPHKHKIVIAGNHDLTFDRSMDQQLSRWHVKLEKVKAFLSEHNVEEVKDLLTNCVYLEDAMVTLYGVNIYGSPWQPEFGDWGFNLPRGKPLLEKWDLIPEETDVLITHGPPVGHGDACFDGNRAGCVELLNTIQKRVKPKYHIFGHIHEGYGVTSDGFTTYINASTCTLRYIPSNPPIVFDLPIPEGHSKQEVVDLTVTQYGRQQDKQQREDTESDIIFGDEPSTKN